MQQQKTNLSKIMLVGITIRTNNKNEMNPSTSKIGELVSLYHSKNIADRIQHRISPGVTYAVYTEFVNKEHGDYTYFIGESVNSLASQDLDKFNTLTIPASDYQRFTTEPGVIPQIIISAWQKIWSMETNDFAGRRTYIADFEIYDERASDPSNAVIDIFIGIE